MMPFHPRGRKKEISMSFMNVDTGFISLMGLEWKEKPFSMAAVMDGRHPVLNEVAVAQIGYTGPAAGQVLDENRTIGGVLKNFNYSSLSSEIKPAALFIGRDTASFGEQENNILFVRLRPHSDVAAALAQIRKLYASFDEKAALSYQFLDEAYDNQYKEEDKLANLMGVFTGITVVIACLGLFALATFAAQQRIREIGIRKVLGASIGGIASKLAVDFLQPVGLSLLVAIPLAGWVMHSWLNGYAYRTSLSWWIFLLAGGGMGIAALATVFFLSLRAARANPTESLRAE
jgi:putative ABC transport system permease protein